MTLIVETSMAYGRNILRGVAEYLQEHGPWVIYLEQRSLQDPVPPWLRDWDGDGIIMHLPPSATRLVHRMGIPAVDLNDQVPVSGGPHIQSDHAAIGALAAEHLLERGFTRFAYFGYSEFAWSRRCFEGFAAVVRSAGYPCDEYGSSQRVTWGHQQLSWEFEVDRVARWIRSLPRPLGLMACNDFRGVQVLDACRRAGVSVPEELAVIGSDNETLACELVHPPLSSVIPDCRRIGYEAAALLGRLMAGGRPPTSSVHIPPLGVAIRRSTESLAVSDPCVADAMQIIREHSCEGLRVNELLARLPVSRSVLQRRFRAVLGRTIHEVIAGVRLQKVKQLLVETDLPMTVIAERVGFSHAEYLSSAFKRATGLTPGAFRRSRGGPSRTSPARPRRAGPRRGQPPG